MNSQLTNQEIIKILQMYENYGAKKLPDFLQMIWKEAYDLGYQDALISCGHGNLLEVINETTSD